jgi:ribosomal protein S18 acetylase RimI-like enzyme
MVDSFLAAHLGQIPEEAWHKRKDEWTYAVSEAGWARTLAGIEDGTLPRTCIYVAVDSAEDEGAVVGLVMGGPAEFTPDTGEINALYVQPGFQGRGYGRALVLAAAAHLAKMGMSALHIGCLAANEPARHFYEALGGRLVEERMFDEEGYLLPEVVYGRIDIRELIAGAQ